MSYQQIGPNQWLGPNGPTSINPNVTSSPMQAFGAAPPQPVQNINQQPSSVDPKSISSNVFWNYSPTYSGPNLGGNAPVSGINWGGNWTASKFVGPSYSGGPHVETTPLGMSTQQINMMRLYQQGIDPMTGQSFDKSTAPAAKYYYYDDGTDKSKIVGTGAGGQPLYANSGKSGWKGADIWTPDPNDKEAAAFFTPERFNQLFTSGDWSGDYGMGRINTGDLNPTLRMEMGRAGLAGMDHEGNKLEFLDPTQPYWGANSYKQKAPLRNFGETAAKLVGGTLAMIGAGYAAAGAAGALGGGAGASAELANTIAGLTPIESSLPATLPALDTLGGAGGMAGGFGGLGELGATGAANYGTVLSDLTGTGGSITGLGANTADILTPGLGGGALPIIDASIPAGMATVPITGGAGAGSLFGGIGGIGGLVDSIGGGTFGGAELPVGQITDTMGIGDLANLNKPSTPNNGNSQGASGNPLANALLAFQKKSMDDPNAALMQAYKMAQALEAQRNNAQGQQSQSPYMRYT